MARENRPNVSSAAQTQEKWVTPSDSSGEACDDRDFNFWILLHQTRDAVYRARGQELSRYGLSNIEAAVLYVLVDISRDKQKHATPAEISRRLLREPHSISRLISRMEKKGLVTKTNDLERKNLVRVGLTDKGRKAYELSKNRISLKKVLARLTEEQREQCRSVLLLIRQSAIKVLGSRQKPRFLHIG